ncbi:hypothetical protein [Burkholderia vietnamiensis]|uniref:hypothetical protein n=1 Tax=Burkholderia vietnamiensis TaxID=60552 RepID=UPI001CF42B02|nr:hypothetical protein [Burkholderia vietnamiensis]MCA8451703.1 hypothetical protein [Burkholderia vietnamiensis]HDR8954967.1 hypothetical protein [Burkholderia vietnamiensis]
MRRDDVVDLADLAQALLERGALLVSRNRVELLDRVQDRRGDEGLCSVLRRHHVSSVGCWTAESISNVLKTRNSPSVYPEKGGAPSVYPETEKKLEMRMSERLPGNNPRASALSTAGPVCNARATPWFARRAL